MPPSITNVRRALGEPRTLTTLALALFVAAFLVPRLPYLLSYRLPLGAPDTLTYVWPMLKLESGRAPTFELRTPGYPIFWWLCRRLTEDVRLVVYAQLATTLLVGAASLVAVARVAPRYVLPAGIALALFVGSPMHTEFDLYLLTESLFTNLLVAYAAALFVALRTAAVRWMWAAATAGTLAILVRPNALFVIPALALAGAWLWWRARRPGAAIAAVVPPAVLLGGLVVYNAATIGRPALTAAGPWALLWSTSVYATPDSSLPTHVNAAILRKDSLIAPADRAILERSSSSREVHAVIERYIWDAIVPIVAAIGKGPAAEAEPYLEGLPLFRRVSETAIHNRPRVRRLNLIGAFVLTQRTMGHAILDRPLSVAAARQYRDTYVVPQPYMTQLTPVYKLPAPPGYTVAADSARTVTPPATLATRLGDFTFRAYGRIVIRSRLWLVTFYLGMVAALIVFARSRGRSADALFLLLLGSAVVGNAVVLSTFGHIERRYGYPLDFVPFLLLTLVPGALISLRRRR